MLDKQIRDTIKQFAQVGCHRGPCRAFRRLAAVPARRQEDHHHHGAEVPVHPRGDRERAPWAQVRHHHRRGALQPGRANGGEDEHGACRRTARRTKKNRSRTRSTASWKSRKMLPNASYFAFTATPKNKTLEIFGEPYAGGRQDQASPLPQLHDEAGHPGRIHPGCPRRTTRRSTAITG